MNNINKVKYKARAICAVAALTAGATVSLSASASGGWYVSGQAGPVWLMDADSVGASTTSKVKYDTGSSFAVAVGYRLSDGLRLELEVNSYDSQLNETNNHFPAPAGSELVVGNTHSLGYLANVWQDIDVNFPIKPYFGFGVGVTQVTLDDLEVSGVAAEEATDSSVTTFQVGLGVNYPITKRLTATAGYRYQEATDAGFRVEGIPGEIDSEQHAHLIQAGFRFIFALAKDKAITPPPSQAADSDGDRVPDDKDMCPETPAGSAVNTDGCRLPVDSDGDRVPDDKDMCPETPAGSAVNTDGCRLPVDDDGDGVLNENDECPDTLPGTRVLPNGCTKIIFEGAQVNFVPASAELSSSTIAPLEPIAEFLRSDPDIKVRVNGHTDGDGSDAYNLDLSTRRAESVKDYLVNAGAQADQIVTRGLGETKPVASNQTKAGRSQNRRVEVEVIK